MSKPPCILTKLIPGSGGIFGSSVTYCAPCRQHHSTALGARDLTPTSMRFRPPSKPARCLVCRQPTSRRLDGDVGLHKECEDMADMARTTSA